MSIPSSVPSGASLPFARYLTPASVRLMGTGLPLAALSDSDLAGWISAAEARIDSYMEFREDIGLGFRQGQRTERAPWDAVHRRFYPQAFPTPVLGVNSFQILVSQSAQDYSPIAATVDSHMLVVNNDEGYIEPISLSVIAYGLTPVLAQLAIIAPFSVVTYTTGYRTLKNAYRLYPDASGLTYHSLLPGWDIAGLSFPNVPDAPTPTVTVNGAAADPSTYTVHDDDGAITFSAPPGAGAAVRATFAHTIPDPVVKAARLLFSDIAGDALVNMQGLSGLDVLAQGRESKTRKGRGQVFEIQPEWQKLLDPYKPLIVAGC